MSDAGRKDFSSQVHDTLKPDSQKGYLEKLGDDAGQAYDKAASAVQPNEFKSTSQKAGDTVRDNTNDAKDGSESYLDQAKDTINSATNAASNFFTGDKK
ncbi:hypothetical protein NADFUDRAFT_44850 [Nadsonia fulvescens var. elongata DSM 6958]|uniref:12 kDa heat shock protein n=1 Tax=Nadsonia fulvescens var. elongata DSM 6958 TaxID=857566 RepID=A0A1E3PSK3_9ASCO|nr:hypothetical protein NADFUDRAFT_44850 [Nadsonia fulvescens var. elongata DSM 6958]